MDIVKEGVRYLEVELGKRINKIYNEIKKKWKYRIVFIRFEKLYEVVYLNRVLKENKWVREYLSI